MPQKITDRQFQNNIAFRAYATTIKSLTTATFTKVDNLNTIEYNYGSGWDATNKRFVAPVDGVYFFTGIVGISNDSARHFMSFYVNGIEWFRSPNGSYLDSSNIATGSTQFKLSAGQYVEMYAWRIGTNNIRHDTLPGLGSLWFGGHLITGTP